MAYMIWTASGKQTVATVEASAEPVKAYFKVKACLAYGATCFPSG